MSTDKVLTRKRRNELKKHTCFIDPRIGYCLKCRALARYKDERVMMTTADSRERAKHYQKGSEQ